MLLSILVPTLEVRRRSFDAVSRRLQSQIHDDGLASQVELLCLQEEAEEPGVDKRNQLIQRASGDFVVFVQDDDEVSNHYITRICQALQNRPETDCIGLRGCISFRGLHSRKFVYSLRYVDRSISDGVYLRPPCYLNPMRRSIAAAFPFTGIGDSDDIAWAQRIQQAAALRTEVFIDKVLYHYRSHRWWPYQWLLDKTERLRYSLALKASNRLQLLSKTKVLRFAFGSDVRNGK